MPAQENSQYRVDFNTNSSAAARAQGGVISNTFADFIVNSTSDTSPNAGFKTIAVAGLVVIAIYLVYRKK